MFIKKIKQKNGRTNIPIGQAYRDERDKSKTRTIKGLGYLELLEEK